MERVKALVMNGEPEIDGDWSVRVSNWGKAPVCLDVSPAPVTRVQGEACGPLPLFNPAVAGWQRGYRLAGVTTQETSARDMLEPQSLRLWTGAAAGGPELARGRDYECDPAWGTVGRLEGGRLSGQEPVFAAYDFLKARLDSIFKRPDGSLILRQGQPHVAQPIPPEPAEGEQRVANLWLPGRQAKLMPGNLFPVLEAAYPEPPRPASPAAARLVPNAFAKLTQGRRLRILAWGDSVTDASYLPNVAKDRWQAQFVARLCEKHPGADIELVTEAWPGRNTTAYLAEPPGAEHNYAEKVLAAKPDLVISEFVNDGGYSSAKVNEVYGRLAADFKTIGAEWIILTPHYILPDWMGLDRHRDIDEDPRACVNALRQFAASHGLALADASKRWGRLWRQGLPYMTFMMNAINHPDPRGMRIFADSLMELF